MKNWLYIPFLVLMAVTYSRVSENFSGITEESIMKTSRGPASVEIKIFNQKYVFKIINLSR
jgi:hypothetical protein